MALALILLMPSAPGEPGSAASTGRGGCGRKKRRRRRWRGSPAPHRSGPARPRTAQRRRRVLTPGPLRRRGRRAPRLLLLLLPPRAAGSGAGCRRACGGGAPSGERLVGSPAQPQEIGQHSSLPRWYCHSRARKAGGQRIHRGSAWHAGSRHPFHGDEPLMSH